MKKIIKKSILFVLLCLIVTACSNDKVLTQLPVEDIPEVHYNRQLEGKIRKLGYRILRIEEDRIRKTLSDDDLARFNVKYRQLKREYEYLVDFIGDNQEKRYERQVMLEYQRVLRTWSYIRTNYSVDRYNSVGVNL